MRGPYIDLCGPCQTAAALAQKAQERASREAADRSRQQAAVEVEALKSLIVSRCQMVRRQELRFETYRPLGVLSPRSRSVAADIEPAVPIGNLNWDFEERSNRDRLGEVFVQTMGSGLTASGKVVCMNGPMGTVPGPVGLKEDSVSLKRHLEQFARSRGLIE
jgi:hypothetical protein